MSAIVSLPRLSNTLFRLYLRFTLSYRDVDDLLAERGLDVSVRVMIEHAPGAKSWPN